MSLTVKSCSQQMNWTELNWTPVLEMYCCGSVHSESWWNKLEFFNWSLQTAVIKLQFWTHAFQWNCSQWPNWTELTSTKLTQLQLQDVLLVTCISITKLIGCSTCTAVHKLQFSSVQSGCCEQIHWKACVQNSSLLVANYYTLFSFALPEQPA